MITLITPVVEVDGRDRMVDVYRWHLAHPKAIPPRLVYWGHYVAHDNNRDAMGLTLSLSRQVLDTYLGWHAQVLHDLHESVPFLYDNTVGDGPYNAWVDPLLTNEWQLFGWMNVAQMGKFGMPGVFTHGDFDTWSPGYLMFLAAMHNGVSRLYETFGNGGADTETRELDPSETSRTWYRQDPPYRTVSWSQRNNNNYEQTGLLVSLAFVAENRELLLRNFWEKSKRSIAKPEREGPAAYVLPADDRRPGAQAELLRVLQLQHVEISRADKAFTVAVESASQAGRQADKGRKTRPRTRAPATRTFPAGSYVVRMDQPFSRSADALLDRQYWSPDDPQKHPYDDTGWCFPALFDTEAVRVTDRQVLAAPMSRVEAPVRPHGGVDGQRLRLRRRPARGRRDVQPPLRARGRQGRSRGRAVQGRRARLSARHLAGAGDREGRARPRRRGGRRHGGGGRRRRRRSRRGRSRKPRIALLHTWLNTQTEGWWRQRLDLLKIPYNYISTQDVAADAEPRGDATTSSSSRRWESGIRCASSTACRCGASRCPGRRRRRRRTSGRSTPPTISAPAWASPGSTTCASSCEQGGLLVGVEDTAQLMIATGMAPGVRVANPKNLKVVGSVLDARFPDPTSPIVDGLGDRLSVYSAEGMSFELSNCGGGRLGRRRKAIARPAAAVPRTRTRRRGAPAQPARPEPAKVERWEARPLEIEELRNNPAVIPEALRPRTLVRFGDADDLLVSGLLEARRRAGPPRRGGRGPVRQGARPALRHQPDLARLDDRQPSAGVERDSAARVVRVTSGPRSLTR